MRNRVSQDVFKNALWGRPIGYFWHVNELRPDEVANFMDALVQGGATLESNTQMVNFLLSCQANDVVPAGYVAGSYYVCASSGRGSRFSADGEFAGEGCGRESGGGVSIRPAGDQSEFVWDGLGDWGLRVCAGEFQRDALRGQRFEVRLQR